MLHVILISLRPWKGSDPIIKMTQGKGKSSKPHITDAPSLVSLKNLFNHGLISCLADGLTNTMLGK